MKHATKQPILILALLITFTTTSYAQAKPNRGFREEGREKFKQELNLTDEQEAKMKELRLKQEEKMIDLRANQKKEQLALKKLMSADQPNKKKLYAQIDKISSADAKIKKARLDHRLKVRSILTDEQLKIYQKGMGKRAVRGGCDGLERRGQRNGGGFPHRRF